MRTQNANNGWMWRAVLQQTALRVVVVGCVALIILTLSILLSPKPDMQGFIENRSLYSQALFDREQRLLRLTLAADQQYRLFTPLEKIAPELIEATLLYEDRNFYQHPGVDVAALLRAFWATYVSGERRVGASTLTMQVARLRWQLPSHTLTGKLEQIWRALQLSWHFGKYEILELYFNLAPYGRNIQGIGAASLIYFDKSPQQLSLPEVLALVVIPQNPVRRNPTTSVGLAQMSDAQNALFERWLIQHPQHADLRAHVSAPLLVRAPEQLPFHAPHFIEHVRNRLGPWRTGQIMTSLDLAAQRKVEATLSRYVGHQQAVGIRNAAALLLDHRRMEIVAMVGSAGFSNAAIQGQVNGTLAKRSPGSTLKPFVYALALDQGLIHPLTLMKDLPRRFGGFAPENFDQRFTGPLSARAALIQSRNVPAVELASQLTNPNFYQFLQQAGVSLPHAPEHYGLALTLGGAEVSMIELVSLYAALANRGEQKPVRHILTPEKSTSATRLFSAEAAFMVLDMLRDTPPPDTIKLPQLAMSRHQVAWKTGTSWAFRDAWAVGISGPYVLAVWLGNFDGAGNPALVGRTAAGPLLFQLFDQLLPAPASAQPWTLEHLIAPETLNLKRVNVCGQTGDLAERGCPSIVPAWFIPGVSPIRMSQIYRDIPVRIDNGLRACKHQLGITRLETHAFWPSDFLAIFRMAGLALKAPPDYGESCTLDQTSAQGTAPRLLSPEAELRYVIDSRSTPMQIPLRAAADPDVQQLYWFIDGAFFGSADKDETLLWQARVGTHQLTVVDDAGRSQSQTVRVVWGE